MKPSEIWKEIKPRIGEMLVAVNDIETRAEKAQEEAYQRGYETAKHECEDCPKQAYTDTLRMDVYQKGLSDAWECARTIFCTSTGELKRIFDLEEDDNGLLWVYHEYTASEAIEKIRQYEQEKEEQIQVGDEVTPRETEYDDMIVTRLWKDDYDSDCIDAIGFDGRISSFLVSRVSKTGKHYEIAEVLQKMRES